MQLSLVPLPNPPAPALPALSAGFTPNGDETASGPAAVAGPEEEALSFEEYFDQNSPAPPGAAGQVSAEMESAAAALAASSWLPAVPVMPPQPESAPAGLPARARLTEARANPVEGPPARSPVEISRAGPAQVPPDQVVLPTAPAQARPAAAANEKQPVAVTAPPYEDFPKQKIAPPDTGRLAITRRPAAPEPPVAGPVGAEAGAAREVTERGPELTVNTEVPRMDGRAPRQPSAPVTANAPFPEKIAGLRGPLSDAGAKTVSPEEKEILSPAHKTVAATPVRLGTAVAEWVQPMLSAPSTRSKSLPVTPTEMPVGTGGSFTAQLAVETAAPVATLREVMATVVSAVTALEQRADIQPKHVDLHFRVGDEPLSLRLELKAGTVHTIFQTASDELRSALSREWGALVPPSAAAHLRLADPVFNAPSDGGNGGTFGSTGQGATPQRGQPGPEPQPFSRSMAPGEAQPPEAPSIAAAVPPSLTLLNAFA